MMTALDKQMALESLIAGIIELSKELDKFENKDNNSITSDERCKQAVEKGIENGEITQSNNPSIQNEIDQLNDGDKRTNEVNDTVIAEAVDEAPYDFYQGMLSFGKKNKRTRAEAKQQKQQAQDELDILSTEDMRAISEMGGTANPYSPDTTNGEIYGDDYKALAATDGTAIEGSYNETLPAIRDNTLPEEAYQEPEITYSIEETREPGIPKEIEDDSHIVGVETPNIPTDTPTSVGGNSQPSISTENADANYIEDTTAGNSINSQSVDSPDSLNYSSGSASEAQKADDMIEQSKATTAAIKDATNESENPVVTNNQSEASGFTTNNGGSLESAGTNKDGSFVSKNPKLEGNDGHSLDSANSDIDLTESTIENLIAAIDKLDDSVAATYNIDKSAYTFNGTAIKDLRPEELNELRNIVMEA